MEPNVFKIEKTNARNFPCIFCRVVGVTGMIESKIGRKIIKDLIKKWDPEVDLRRLIYES